MLDIGTLFPWTRWQEWDNSWRSPTIPAQPGLYRIRRVGRDDLDYIGQTGTTLRKRLSMLKGILADEMPYRAPHTVAPALWALRHGSGCSFEVSVVVVEGATPSVAQWRKGLEAVAISLYRQEYGRSPNMNFGRMPEGYRMSSSNDAKLVQANKRYRGGLVTEPNASHEPSIAPVGKLEGNPQGEHWCGHAWSTWMPVSDALRQLSRHSQYNALGLYRMRDATQVSLVYIGQGLIGARLKAHLDKIRLPGHEQGRIFRGARQLECSWVTNDLWLHHQRLELENDLIAAHVLVSAQVPTCQFLGGSLGAA